MTTLVECWWTEMLGSSAHGWPQRYVMYTKGWAARMTTLGECWNKLDGNVGELSSWVATKVRSAYLGGRRIIVSRQREQT
jgi:hypothetical protein